MEINKRTFDYDQKETYTPNEVADLLKQHQTFVEGGSKKELEDLQKKATELEASNSKFKTAERQRQIKKLAKEVSADNYEKLIKYTSVAEDADEAAIKKALETTAKDFVAPVSTKQPPVEKKGNVQTPTEEKLKINKDLIEGL